MGSIGTSTPTAPPPANGASVHHSKTADNDNDQNDSAARLIRELDTHNTHTLPLWAQMAKLNPPEPNPVCVPHIWRYEEVRPYLMRAGKLISEREAERRVLMLVNPAKGTYRLYY